MSTGKVVLGALAGLAIGAIAGILFAPEKGSTTRRKIIDKGDDYVDGIKSKFNDVRDTLTDKYESTKKDAEGFVNRGKAKYDEAKRDVKNAAADFNQATS
ncbi:MAG: YtxH domain-containing protein [Bacteroidales bacterium]|nr:YtxH domain-containing protein [Bacteroidales bacterium]